MAKLVSMKITKADREKQSEPSIAATAPEYPWGLSIDPDNVACKKLGLDVEELKAGAELGIIARVSVSRISVNDSANGGKHQSVSLQITELCVESDVEDAAGALYK